ncbi:hypothetical protein L915_07844, partial [Phytophthora nicotianae]
ILQALPVYLVADNCATNGCIASLMKVPFVGYASHRLNLVVVEYMGSYEPILDKVKPLMHKLHGEKKLGPVLRQATRLSSTFNMVRRYFDNRDAIDTLDDAMAVLMPIRREESQLETLLDELKAFESSSKKLQSAEGLSLLDVRDIFDALITEHSGVESYLAADAAIVQQPEFEDACISVLMGKADTLTEQQRALLLPFAAPTSPRQGVDDEELSFVDRALENASCSVSSHPSTPRSQ